jgi:hypothetical protein
MTSQRQAQATFDEVVSREVLERRRHLSRGEPVLNFVCEA